MDPGEAILAVLEDADEPLHWTVIQDRALKEGYLDPFTVTDVRALVLSSLRVLSDGHAIERVAKGTYRLAPGGGLPVASERPNPTGFP